MLLSYTNSFHDSPAQVASGDDVQTSFNEVATVLNGNVDTDNLADAAVTTNKIEASAITAALIQDGAVGSDEIAASAVIAAKIGAGAVTSTGLGAQAVTEAKMEYTVASSGVRLPRIAGTDTTNFGTEGIAFCRCLTSVASGKTGVFETAVTFASEHYDGAPTWAANPLLIGWSYYVNSATQTDAPAWVWLKTESTSTPTLELYFSGTSGVAGSLVTLWIGKVNV